MTKTYTIENPTPEVWYFLGGYYHCIWREWVDRFREEKGYGVVKYPCPKCKTTIPVYNEKGYIRNNHEHNKENTRIRDINLDYYVQFSEHRKIFATYSIECPSCKSKTILHRFND